MKQSFLQFLFEAISSGSINDSNPHIKVDVVDMIRRHANNNELLYGNLRAGKEAEMFKYYFDKISSKYQLGRIKHKNVFTHGFEIFYESPNMKPGHYIRVSSTMSDAKVARQVFDQLTSQH